MYDELVKRLRYKAGWDESGDLEQAADAIEELTATAESYKRSMEMWAEEAARAQPRWIPVTERLPKKFTDVLVYYERDSWPDGADYPVRKREIGIGFCGGPDRWHVDNCSGVVGLAWMPLPEPPEEAK